MYRLALLFVSIVIGLSACTAHAKKNPVKSTDNKSLLWRITGNGLKKPSYLMGTIHAICASDYLWTDSMQKAFESTQKVCFEMDLDDPALQITLATAMMKGNDDKGLREYYTEEEYNKIASYLKDSLNLPVEMMQQVDPSMLAAMMATKLVSCEVSESYEGNIMKLAQKKEMEIVGLETAEQQLAIFENMNSDSTATGLLQMIESMDSMRQEYNKLLASYKAQDLPAMYDLIIHSPDMKGIDLNDFLFNRNKNWIPQIKKMTAAQPMFIAVGAGHLWGDEGVINLLRQAGYTVEPVK